MVKAKKKINKQSIIADLSLTYNTNVLTNLKQSDSQKRSLPQKRNLFNQRKTTISPLKYYKMEKPKEVINNQYQLTLPNEQSTDRITHKSNQRNKTENSPRIEKASKRTYDHSAHQINDEKARQSAFETRKGTYEATKENRLPLLNSNSESKKID